MDLFKCYDSIQGKAAYRGIVNMNNFDVGAIAESHLSGE